MTNNSVYQESRVNEESIMTTNKTQITTEHMLSNSLSSNNSNDTPIDLTKETKESQVPKNLNKKINKALNLMITCKDCGVERTKTAMRKHRAIYHDSIEEKLKYFKGNYCIDCEYGDVQNDKFNKHLETKKHKDNISKKTIITKKKNLESLFEYLLNKIKEILIDYKYFETYYICKLKHKEINSIVITRSRIEDKFTKLKKKLKTDKIELSLIQIKNIQTTIEKELLYDYYVKENNIENEKVKNLLSGILFSTDIDYDMKKMEIDQKIESFKAKFNKLAPSLILLQNKKPINIKIVDTEDNWLKLGESALSLYKLNLTNNCFYKYENNELYYNFPDSELEDNIVSYCNIICVYNITISDSNIYTCQKYEGNFIKVLKNKLINIDDKILELINQNPNNFTLKLIGCFMCREYCPLYEITEFLNNFNKSTNIRTNVSNYFKVNINIINDFLQFENDANIPVAKHEIFNLTKFIESTGKPKRGPPASTKSIEEREREHRIQKINYIRKKSNKEEIKDLNEIKIKENKKKINEDTLQLINNIPNVGDQTKKCYVSKLNCLVNLGINIYEFDEKEMNKIIEIYNSNAKTLQNNLQSIKVLLDAKKAPTPKFLQDKINETRKVIDKKLNSNTMTKRQKDTFTDWETVLQIHNRLKETYEKYKTSKNLMRYLYVSLYTFLPPRRLEDYRDMILDNSQIIPDDQNNILYYRKYEEELPEEYDYDTSTFFEHSDENLNYITFKGNEAYFVFNCYKTKKSYGRQYVNIPNCLKEIIIEYIKVSRIEEYDKIFKCSSSQMSVFMQNIFNEYIKRNTSVSDLRHIFINYHKKNTPDVGFIRKNTALLMAHSKSMQDEYNKVDEVKKAELIEKIHINIKHTSKMDSNETNESGENLEKKVKGPQIIINERENEQMSHIKKINKEKEEKEIIEDKKKEPNFKSEDKPKLIIIRGIPGSGKTTHAKLYYPNYVCVSADDYFYKDNVYNFNIKNINVAHSQCFNKVKKLLNENKSCVVANTFVSKDDLFKYIDAFSKISEIKVIRMMNEFKSVHDVPFDTINRFKNNFYSYSEEEQVMSVFDSKLVGKDNFFLQL